MRKYSKLISELVASIYSEIVPILMKESFVSTVGYTNCTVEILNNDFQTVWVRWGKYDCEFKDLPPTAMGTLADHILNN